MYITQEGNFEVEILYDGIRSCSVICVHISSAVNTKLKQSTDMWFLAAFILLPQSWTYCSSEADWYSQQVSPWEV